MYAKRIRSIRVAAGLSQQEVAKVAHVSQSLLSALENGYREADTELVTTVEAAIGELIEKRSRELSRLRAEQIAV